MLGDVRGCPSLAGLVATPTGTRSTSPLARATRRIQTPCGHAGVVEVRKFFEDRFDVFGDSPRTLDLSPEGQSGRFAVLSEIGDISNKRILELGSGLGHFYEYLCAHFGGVRYTGYDFSPKFVEYARAKYPNAVFEIRDVLAEPLEGSYDYVVCSGIHNLETGSNDKDMDQLMTKAWGAATEGVALSMLSQYADRKEEGRHYYDPRRVLSRALQLTRYVVLRQDYMPHDFTVYLYRKTAARNRVLH